MLELKYDTTVDCIEVPMRGAKKNREGRGIEKDCEKVYLKKILINSYLHSKHASVHKINCVG